MSSPTSNTSISVVIPSCDRPVAVQGAVASVLAQTAKPCEIIVVENGADRIDAATLPADVTLVELEPYAGVSRARNEGASVARGEYVAFLDDDDTWAPDYLEKMHAAIAEEQHPDLLTGHKVRVEGGSLTGEDNIERADNLMPTLLYRNIGVGGQNVVARRRAFLEVGGYDERLQNAEDRGLALDFIREGKQLAHVPGAMVLMGRNQKSRLKSRSGQLEDRQYFFSKYEHMMSGEIWLKAKMFVLRFEVRESQTRAAHWWARLKHLVLRLLHEATKRLESDKRN